LGDKKISIGPKFKESVKSIIKAFS